MKTDSRTQHIGGAVAEAVRENSVDTDAPRTPIDYDALQRDYLNAARRETARQRYELLIEDAPSMAETDWDREHLRANQAQIAKVLEWQLQPQGLLLSGPTGRGKTRSIYALLKRLSLEEGQDFRYWHAGDWFSHLQDQQRYGRDDARNWVKATAKHRLVVLDDLGQEAVAWAREDWAQSWFFRFLDERIMQKLPLIVSTNLTAMQMGQQRSKKQISQDPLLRRLLELAEPVRFL